MAERPVRTGDPRLEAHDIKETRGYRYEIATWKIGKNLRHRSRICAEVSGHTERMPCVTIQR